MSPLTKKGEKIKKELVKEYGKKKGESVLYAMEKKGTAKGITKKTAKKKTTSHRKSIRRLSENQSSRERPNTEWYSHHKDCGYRFSLCIASCVRSWARYF